jgi:predicted DNA-binding transcriptional regulator AlpA
MLRRSVKTTRNKLREEGAPKPLEHFLPAIRWDREEVQRWIESRK